jgi:hypothetical protein
MRPEDFVHDSGFRTALVVATLALPVVVVLVAWTNRGRRRRTDPIPVAGIAFVVAALIGLDHARGGATLNGPLVVGIASLILGPVAVAFTRSGLATTLSTIPGALFVAWAVSLDNDVGWITPAAFLATVVGAALLIDFDKANSRAGLGPVLLAVTALSAYTALPDTEQVAAVVGAALPIALLGTPLAIASLGTPGAAGAVGVFVWVAAVGGRARPGAFIGALACFGVVLVEPFVRRVLPRRRLRQPRVPLSPRTILVIALDVALVIGTSRVAGLETSALTASLLSALLLAASATVLTLLLTLPWRRTKAGPRRAIGNPTPSPPPTRPATDPMLR